MEVQDQKGMRMTPSHRQNCLLRNKNFQRDMFREIFNEIADVAGVLSDNLIITSWNSRVYPSATPQSIGIWTEGELREFDFNLECLAAYSLLLPRGVR